MLLALLALLPRAQLELRGAALISILFPSWRFFEDSEQVPQLAFRSSESGEPLGAWRDGLPTSPRRLWNLFIDPQGARRLAYGSLLDRLMSDLAELGDHDDPEALVSFVLVENLVRKSLPGSHTRFEWKLWIENEDGRTEDVLVSPERTAT